MGVGVEEVMGVLKLVLLARNLTLILMQFQITDICSVHIRVLNLICELQY